MALSPENTENLKKAVAGLLLAVAVGGTAVKVFRRGDESIYVTYAEKSKSFSAGLLDETKGRLTPIAEKLMQISGLALNNIIDGSADNVDITQVDVPEERLEEFTASLTEPEKPN